MYNQNDANHSAPRSDMGVVNKKIRVNHEKFGRKKMQCKIW